MGSYSTSPISSGAAAPTHWVNSQSPVMNTIERTVEELAPGSCPILLIGPSGTGKHALAFRIYELSSRVNRSFLELECTNAPDDAFAPKSRFVSCGTLHLSNVGELEPRQQNALFDLYFGGGADWSKLPRLIASSTDAGCSSGHPLFCCLQAGVVFHLPQLHARGCDVIALANHFIANYADMFGRPQPELSAEVAQFFVEYRWPGNLDELEAACKTLVALGDQRTAVAALRASVLRPVSDSKPARSTSLKYAARMASQHAERALILDVLQNTGGNRKQAARQLQISYKALLYKLKQVGLSGPAARGQEEGGQA
jgi:DNA-binding NtrC family response regulator